MSTEQLDQSNSAISVLQPFHFNVETGLRQGINYQYNEDGSINWRALIKPEFLYPNSDWFLGRKQDIPDSIEGLSDKQLLIMLGGIKELAKIRGFTRVSYDIKNVDSGYIQAKCSISWTPNFETGGMSITFEDIGNATIDNTDSFCHKFLETIACNRAFVRCVRNFLNIHIVGADEIDKSKNRANPTDEGQSSISNANPLDPNGVLEKLAFSKLKINSFDQFKDHLRKLYVEAKDNNNEEFLNLLQDANKWKSFSDIPVIAARTLAATIA